MKQKPKEAPEVDPRRGDAILRRMLKTKPKPHKDMVRERQAKKRSPLSVRNRTSDVEKC